MPITVYKTDGTSYEYSYDVNDKRVRKAGGGMETYYINGLGGETEVVMPAASGQNYTYNIWGNGLVGQVKNTNGVFNRYYYLKDHLGNIRVTVNSAGTVVGYDDYSPYGMQLDGRSMASSADSRYKFIGVERDAETGLDHNGDRSYDSRLGRSTSIDPFAMKSPGLSPYSYAGNNPVIAIDANGDEIWLVDGQDSVEYTGLSTSYKGRSDFIKKLIANLNSIMRDEQLGPKVVKDLINSFQPYRYRQASEGELGVGVDGQFAPAWYGWGGEMIIGNLSLGTIAHETLHGDLHEWGLGEASDWNECEAYAFQYRIMGLEFNDEINAIGLPGNRSGSDPGPMYNANMARYVNSNFDDGSGLINAVRYFQEGSRANNPGLGGHPYNGLNHYGSYQNGRSFLKFQMGR